jgi:hypothetical protein
VEEVTADWLTGALGLGHPGTVVTEARLVDRIDGMARKLRLELTYDGDTGLPRRMILKANLGGWPIEYEGGNQLEAAAYRHFLPTVEANTPACFYAGIDGDGYTALLLEDLNERPVVFGDPLRPHDYATAAAFLDLYARIHARWWGSPGLAPGGRFGWVPEPMGPGLGIDEWIKFILGPEDWAQTMQLPRATAMPRALRDRERVAAAIAALRLLHRQGPLTLTHGDEHPRNLFVDADGKPGFVDLQTKIAPWHLPFAYYLGGNLDIEDRRDWEKPLLAHYLARLQAYGVTPPAWSEAWLDYRRELVFGYLIFLCNRVEMQPETVNATIANRFGMAMIDHRTLDLF